MKKDRARKDKDRKEFPTMIDALAAQQTSFLSVLNNPYASAGRLREILRTLQPEFAFCIGSTCTSDHDGISAAGASPNERRLTPSIDADILLDGHPRDNECLPASPIGVVSPVVVSAACLELASAQVQVIDCGAFRPPLRASLQAGDTPANCVSTGNAMTEGTVQSLFDNGLTFIDSIAKDGYLIIGECVPGGTTSALAVLTGAGIAAHRLVGSSAFNDVRDLKARLVEEGLAHAGISTDNPSQDPIQLLSAVGDPMQPFAAGLTLAASQVVPVVLAGGAQMLAVYHLCRLFSKAFNLNFNTDNVFVITTKWLAGDKHSDTSELSRLVSAPFFASMPDFHQSRFDGLRAYENGHVKEGTGAGALMAAAQAKLSLSNAALVEAIDATYARLVGTETMCSQPITEVDSISVIES